MNIEHEIIKLIGELKKVTDPEKKKNIKHKLKQLYKKLNRVRLGKKDMTVEFKLPIKKEVEELLSGQKEDYLKNKAILLKLKRNIGKEVEKLQEAISVETDPKKLDQLTLKLDEKLNEIKQIEEISVPQSNKIKVIWKDVKDASSLKEAIKQELQNKPALFTQFEQTGKIPIDLSSTVGKVMSKINKLQGTNLKSKDILNESLEEFSRRPPLPSEIPQIREQLEAKAEAKSRRPSVLQETEDWFKQWTSPSDIEESQQLSKAIADAEKEIAKQEKAQALSESQKQAIYEAYVGFGKRKKMKGGAGISDYLSVLGNMPGLSQMAGMVPIIGPMLGPAIGLAQTGSNIASQGMKEAGLGPGEQVKGLFGTIGKLFGFGKNKQLSPMGEEFLKIHISGGALHPFYKKHKSKLNKAGIHSLESLNALKGCGFLSDIMGTIGGITPHLSSLLGFIPGAGPILQMGNSAIGSATRVGEDIFKKIGLGKHKRAGRKMLPNPFTQDGLYPENEMNDGMAYIQPYHGSGNLPNGGNVSEEFEDQLNQQIVQLLKNRHLDEIRNTDAFNAQLAAKTNTEQQSAVFQLLYQQLLNNAQRDYQKSLLEQ
jgi:hypothetical protein